jgi:chromosome segregation ATPase
MSGTLERYNQLKEKVAGLESEKARLEGRLERSLSELKNVGEEIGEDLSTVAKATKFLKKLKKQHDRTLDKLQAKIDAFDETWGTYFDQ